MCYNEEVINLFRKTMGIIVNKNQQMDNELTRRIDADLRGKALKSTGENGNNETPDFAEDSEYVKNFKKTSKFGWVWIILIILAIVGIICILI